MDAQLALKPILPLATVDDLRVELEDTQRALLRLGDGLVVDSERLLEKQQRLLWWVERLRAQLDQMEATVS